MNKTFVDKRDINLTRWPILLVKIFKNTEQI